jgi:hypothetical protein
LEVATKVLNKKGEKIKVVTYPGLADDDNWKDRLFISVLAEKVPFMKEFGQVCDVWKDMVEYLNVKCINGDELVCERVFC